MAHRKVRVIAYDGYRSGEKPRSFILDGITIDIAEIIAQWIEESFHTRQQRRFFQVQGEDAASYLLSYDGQTGEWYLESPGQI